MDCELFLETVTVILTKKIEDTSKRIAKTIDGLRAFSRDSHGDPYEKVKVKSIIQKTLVFCEYRFKAHGITLKVEKIDPDLMIECRPVQISQILLNLLSNAYAAVKDAKDPWISIGLKTSANEIILSVTDSGSPIPKKVADKMFQPFFTSKPIGEGTGLGLSISKGFAEMHRGKLIYENNSKHTKFVLTLPKIQSKTKGKRAALKKARPEASKFLE